jgi:type I site-specific restriction endonuclease
MFRASTPVESFANDGEIGEQFLREFQDNEKTIPTVLTTSQKLSTGVDVRNIRNIVLMRPVNQIIEFKQIVGRGTRLFDGGTENNGFIIWVGFIHKNLNPFGFALLDFNDFIEICFFV